MYNPVASNARVMHSTHYACWGNVSSKPLCSVPSELATHPSDALSDDEVHIFVMTRYFSFSILVMIWIL